MVYECMLKVKDLVCAPCFGDTYYYLHCTFLVATTGNWTGVRRVRIHQSSVQCSAEYFHSFTAILECWLIAMLPVVSKYCCQSVLAVCRRMEEVTESQLPTYDRLTRVTSVPGPTTPPVSLLRPQSVATISQQTFNNNNTDTS